MNHLRIIFLLILAFVVSACTTANFNKQYADANWKTIAVVPLNGEGGDAVESILFHQFATNTAIRLLEPETVAAKINEMELADKMATTPVAALVDVSKALGADGFIYGTVETGSKQFIDQPARYAKVDLRLYSNEGVIVGSSVNDSSSVFFSTESNIERATRDTIEEFTEFFEILNSSF